MKLTQREALSVWMALGVDDERLKAEFLRYFTSNQPVHSFRVPQNFLVRMDHATGLTVENCWENRHPKKHEQIQQVRQALTRALGDH